MIHTRVNLPTSEMLNKCNRGEQAQVEKRVIWRFLGRDVSDEGLYVDSQVASDGWINGFIGSPHRLRKTNVRSWANKVETAQFSLIAFFCFLQFYGFTS